MILAVKKGKAEEGTESWTPHLSSPVVHVSALGSLQATRSSELFFFGKQAPQFGFLILGIYGHSATAVQSILTVYRTLNTLNFEPENGKSRDLTYFRHPDSSGFRLEI